ncbi:MAG: outer membrane lipoprotein-sorting protein [Treponema sp.]|nr:outer membrane lipoprotein-sorting protein [Treponema sp.]
MKKFVSFIVGVLVSAAGLTAQNADDIVTRSRNRISATSTSTQSRMVVLNRDKTTNELIINQYSQDDSQGNARTLVEFLRPNTVRGSRFLTVGNVGGAANKWIFLPKLGKVRRIATAEGEGSFMGTDFSYEDIASLDRAADADVHALLKEENFGGRACYVIESKPKDKTYQYSRIVSWIGKNDSLNYKMELYDKKDKLVKIFESSNFQDVQGRVTARQSKMSTLSTGGSTTIYVDKISYDDKIPEGVFTPNYLETGKY